MEYGDTKRLQKKCKWNIYNTVAKIIVLYDITKNRGYNRKKSVEIGGPRRSCRVLKKSDLIMNK